MLNIYPSIHATLCALYNVEDVQDEQHLKVENHVRRYLN